MTTDEQIDALTAEKAALEAELTEAKRLGVRRQEVADEHERGKVAAGMIRNFAEENLRLVAENKRLREALGAYKAFPEIHEMLTAKGVSNPIITDGEQGYCRVCRTEWRSPSMEHHAPLHWAFLEKTGIFAAALSEGATE